MTSANMQDDIQKFIDDEQWMGHSAKSMEDLTYTCVHRPGMHALAHANVCRHLHVHDHLAMYFHVHTQACVGISVQEQARKRMQAHLHVSAYVHATDHGAPRWPK